MANPGTGMLIKPNQIDQLPFLDTGAKEQYKAGLTTLWRIYESNPEGSKERTEAYEKIKTASSKLMTTLVQQRRPPSQGQGRPNQPQQPGNMQPQQAQQLGQQQNQQQQQGQPGQMTAQQQQQMQQARAAHAQQARQQQQPGQQGGQGGMLPLSAKAQQDLTSVTLVIPLEQQESWKQSAIAVLQRRDHIYRTAQQFNQHIQKAKSQGQEVPPQINQKFEEAKRAMEQANRNWTMVKARGEGQQPMLQPQAQQQINAAQAQQHQNPNPSQQQQQQRPGTQQGQVNSQPPPQQPPPGDPTKPVAQEQRASQSPQQPQGAFQQQQQQQPNAPGQTPTQQSTPAPSQPPPSQPQPPQQQQQQQAPQNIPAQPQAPPNFPSQPTNVQQQRPPQINTQLQNPNQMGPQQGNGSAMPPNSGNQQPPQRPQPLNHQQAMSQAADAYSRSQQQSQQQGPQQQLPNGLPFNNQPPSATQQSTPTYPNLQTTQQSSASTKFPIPKQLQLDPRTQTPVAGPPSRPTLNNSGMMYNPGIQRPPPYTLEGEGDRVLSKRKLDELVRQVTGAAPAASESESSSVLTPEVEEHMLELADDFVDNLITQACRLAKLRPNQTLDIRDIQMVLERNYGIRIPGYSLDEARTVKKFQPAPGWQQKMQAVQAGKVMSNRDA
jgi:hypothetical protein